MDIISEEVKASIKWLKTNQVPWDSVLDHWKLTSTLRLSQIIDFDQLQLTEVKLDKIVLDESFEVLKECSSFSDRDETGNKCAEKLLEINVING